MSITAPGFRKLLLILAGCLLTAACGGGGGGGDGGGGGGGGGPIPAFEQEAGIQQDYDASRITLQGMVLDETGVVLAGAGVSIAGRSVTTGADGRFELAQMPRANALLSVISAGQRSEYLPIYLSQPAAVATVTLDPVVLSASQPAGVRMLFGGDVAFGRRFLDPDESTPRDQLPPDDPDALILASDPEPGTRAVLAALRPWFQEADFGVINFETPVTDNPATPHETKELRLFHPARICSRTELARY